MPSRQERNFTLRNRRMRGLLHLWTADTVQRVRPEQRRSGSSVVHKEVVAATQSINATPA